MTEEFRDNIRRRINCCECAGWFHVWVRDTKLVRCADCALRRWIRRIKLNVR